MYVCVCVYNMWLMSCDLAILPYITLHNSKENLIWIFLVSSIKNCNFSGWSRKQIFEWCGKINTIKFPSFLCLVTIFLPAINPCSRQVCDLHADCLYLGPNRHKCTCQYGYKGDGRICIPMDPCQTKFGNCPAKSSVCKYDGPGKVSIKLKQIVTQNLVVSEERPIQIESVAEATFYSLPFWPPSISLNQFPTWLLSLKEKLRPLVPI